ALRALMIMRIKWFATFGMALLLSTIGLRGAASRSSGPAGVAPASLADAAEKMDRAGVRALLRQHVDVNAPQADGMTALHWAAYLDDLETAKLLTKADADLKATNAYGVTPLSLACINGNGPLVELLLDAGADPNTTLRGGESALMT